MHRRIKIGAVVAFLACLGFSFAASGSTSSVAASGGSDARTIHVVEHAITDTQVPPTPDQTGAVLTFHNPVFNKADTKQVGSDRGDCVRIVPGASGTWECRWTTFLSGGQITVEGPFNDTSNTVLSITGGTGNYRDARGQMPLLSRNGGAEFDFIFQLSD
ncbi:MAG TPA: Allene oxide cyclase [Candidatus Dormibacteraeota bacterium]